MKSEYKRLGDFISIVDERNRDLKIKNLLGLSMTKQFRPSTSNIIGVDLGKYKVVRKWVFAFDTMSVIRVHKVPIAINNSEEPIIVSPAYFTFQIKDTNILNPEYLMLWFCRPEFDRYADFRSDAAVRGGYNWEELCDTPIEVPSIEKQKEIVSNYQILSKRIENNEKLISKLEETAKTLYKKMFVEGIDKENLPEGWRMGTLGELANVNMGQSPSGDSYNTNKDGEIFYQGRTDFGYRYPSIRMYTNSPTKIAQKEDILLSVRAPVGDINIAPHKCCIGRGLASIRAKNDCQNYLFYLLQSLSQYFNICDDDGTVFGSINKDGICNIKIVIAPEHILKEFNNSIKTLDNLIKIKEFEIRNLKEMQSLLLTQLGK